MAGPGQRTVGNSQDALLNEVRGAIAQVRGCDAGNAAEAIRPDAFLGADLGLSSIAVARLAGILQQRCGRGPLPFHTLFVNPDRTLRQDIRVAEVAAFLERHLRPPTP